MGPQCPTVPSPPVGSRMRMAGSGAASTCSGVDVRLVLEGGCPCAPQNLPHPPLWPEAGCHHSDSLSSLQLSLGPGASCLRRPLRPAKCPSGHCLCALGIWAACPCTATRSPLFPPPPPAVATIPAAAPSVARGAAEWWGVHSLGRAVVRGRRGSSSDNQHRGRGHWLSKAGRKESLVEVGRQLV